MRRYLLPLVLLSLAGEGCYSYQHLRPGMVQPATAPVAADQQLVIWRRAIQVLLDNGYVPDLLDQTALFIRAKLRDDLADDTTSKVTVVVVIGTDGVLRVEVSGSGLFADDTKLAADIVHRQEQILHDIVTQAPAAPAAPAPAF